MAMDMRLTIHPYKAAVLLALCSIPIGSIIQHLNVITSPSIPYRFTWTVSGAPKYADYAMFKLQHPILGEKPVSGTKQIRCINPQTLLVKGREYYCDGDYLGHAKELGLKGQALPQFIYNGIVPEGKAFLYGNSQDSFDSKYWGFKDINELTRVIPLI